MIPIISTDGCSLDSLLIPSHYQQDLQRILIPHGLIKDRVAKLAHDIAKDTRNPLVACCVLKGAFGFYADLISCLKKNKNAEGLNIPMSFEFLKVKSYVNDQSTGSVEISLSEQDLSTFKGKDILIVEDIIDTGYSTILI